MPQEVKRVFDENVSEYESWFSDNYWAYQTEVEAVRELLPEGRGVEIGVGSGRFAAPLGIKTGVDISPKMIERAVELGIDAIEADALNLPFEDHSFDFSLFIVSICFIHDPLKALQEAGRIVSPEGQILVGIVDKDTPLGKIYLEKKQKSKFYKYANFFSSGEIIELLARIGFRHIDSRQCLFRRDISNMKGLGEIRPGFGEGGFVVLRFQKH